MRKRSRKPRPVRQGSPAELLEWLLYHREHASRVLLRDFGLPEDSAPDSLPNVPPKRRIDARMLYRVLDCVRDVREAVERGDAAAAAYGMHLLDDAVEWHDLGDPTTWATLRADNRERASAAGDAKAESVRKTVHSPIAKAFHDLKAAHPKWTDAQVMSDLSKRVGKSPRQIRRIVQAAAAAVSSATGM